MPTLLLALALLAPTDQPPPIGAGPAAVASQDGEVPIPPPTPLALRHHRTGNALWVVNQVWALLVPAALLVTGVSARLRDAAWALGRKWFFAVGAYLVLYLGLNFLIDLPLDAFETFLRPHAYGLSDQAFGKWLGDALKGLLLSMVLGVLVAWVPYRLMDRSPRRWWLYTGLLVVPFLFFMALIKPVAIDPLFNGYGPMTDRALESKINAQAERAGIHGGRIFQVDKSRDTRTVNAYVTGFLDTKRIVLWDTIFETLDERELLFVLGHEMGHYALNHVAQGILVSSLLVLIGLGFVDRAGWWLIRRKGNWLGIDRLGDVASWPLVMLLAHVAMLVLLPIGFAFSRRMEHEADRFALELTRDNRAGASSFVALQRDNLGVPRPGLLYKVWRASHPTLGDRIDFCNNYHPWRDGQPLQYGHLFRDPERVTQPARGRSGRPPKIRAT